MDSTETQSPTTDAGQRELAVTGTAATTEFHGQMLDLSLGGLDREEFLEQMLLRFAQAGGAVFAGLWLHQPAGLRLAKFVNLSSVRIRLGGEDAPGGIRECVARVQRFKSPLVVPPGEGGTNSTPYTWVFRPFQRKGEFLGIGLFMFPPSLDPAEDAERGLLLDWLPHYISARRLSANSKAIAQRGENLKRFAGFSAGLLRQIGKEHLPAYAVNEIRHLSSADRATILKSDRGGPWKVVAVSGTDEVEKASVTVKAMESVTAELLAGGAATGSAGPDSASVPQDFSLLGDTSFAFASVLDGGDERLRFALLLESASATFLPEPPVPGEPPDRRLQVTTWLSNQAGLALAENHRNRSMPLHRVVTALDKARGDWRHVRTRRPYLVALAIAALVLVLMAMPWRYRIDGTCQMLPSSRAQVVNEIPGRVTRVAVRESDTIAATATILEIDDKRLQSELDVAGKDIGRLEAEARRHEEAGDLTSFRIASLQAAQARAIAATLEEDIRRCRVASPIAGVVLTKDMELLRDKVLAAGEPLCEVAALDAWDLQIEIPEADFGRLRSVLEKGKPCPVEYILQARSDTRVKAELKELGQVSQMAYIKDTRNIFYITLPRVEVPADLLSQLRPGFTGRARVELGWRPLGVVLFGKLYDYARYHWIF